MSVLLALFLFAWLSRGFWALKIGESLICAEQSSRSDAFLLDNFDPNYLVFERANALQRSGVASRVFVPIETFSDLETSNPVAEGLAELMARVARLEPIEFIPIDTRREPITLNAAMQIRNALTRQHVTSVTVVTPAFRSRRSVLIYRAVMVPAGIRVDCVPVFGERTANNWTHSWHGMEEVMQQFIKLQYYRFWVLR